MVNIFALAGPNSKYKLPRSKPAGFWAGLWHGLIWPITLIISHITHSHRVYETKNQGRRYDMGFITGIFVYFFSLVWSSSPGKLIVLW